MKTLQLPEANARKMWVAASPEIKNLLTDSFGADFFNQSITDRVKDFNDILDISGKSMADISRPGDTPDEVAYKQAKLIAEVYNEGTVLDPMDTTQYKYYPWHKIDKSSGFGLSYADYDGWLTRTRVGSRLCFKSSSLAIDAGKKFIEIYAALKIQ
ncbi:hypothetical protein ACLOAU_14455 [Niabella sp. CJ426]|uniref:hypothetical protein n=1 Tax=Niabella sp. CJ426 TaxID=3393740 RepID=UPI003CFE7FF9